MKNKRFGILRWLGAPLLVVALALLVISNLQSISDYVKLRGYNPPPDVVRLADETTMTDKARKLFYVNHPQVADRSSFNDVCNNNGEQTIVLGCYHSVDRGIFLFDVQDARLDGVEHVTAAHEMLHAAYDRLGDAERASINAQLQNFYDTSVKDERIRETMAAYEESEPDDVVNEMHSIFASEIATLPTELETYYDQYFSDRAKVVAYASAYQQEFSDRQDRVESFDLRLVDLKNQIDENTATLKRREEEIATLQRQLEDRRNSGDVETYNASVPIYNTRVDQYNNLIRTTQNTIAEYNRLVAERNELALEVKELTTSISSQLAPIER